MRASEFVTESQLDEGWRETLAGVAAAGAMAMGTPGTAQAAVPPQKVQQMAQAVSTPAAQVLKKTAMAAGLRGTELAQFMAQCAHETQNFTRLVEFGGSLDFRKYDPKYNPRKARILGNKQVGDGARYKGRGFIQLTGRDNYRRAGSALGLPLEQQPELVERPDVAAKVAVWYWKNRVAPKVDNFADTAEVTRPINAGLRGLQDRDLKFRALRATQLAPRGQRT